MLGTLLFFKDCFSNIITITFTALIFTEMLNVYSSVHKFDCKNGGITALTVFIYVSSILLQPKVFNMHFLTMINLAKILLITLLSWIPLHSINEIIEFLYPNEIKKLKD